MKEVPLTRGYVAFIDEGDLEKVSQHSWYAKILTRKDGSPLVYAKSRFWDKEDKTSKLVSLHRFVLGITDSSIQVDHSDGNGLNCCKENLRIADSTQQLANRGKRGDHKHSKFKGVNRWKNQWKYYWRTRISCKGKRLQRLFDTELGAALEYDWYALKLFGEFARTNFKLCPLVII